MDNYKKLMKAIDAYIPSPVDLLDYLRFQRYFHGDDFCTDEHCTEEDEFWGTYDKEVPRDEDDYILLEEALEWSKRKVDEFYSQGELAPFVRTMQRTEALKEELMASAWHPKRIERLLEIGGWEALDNFAGL